MNYWWFIVLLVSLPFDGFQRIAQRNQFSQQAEAAYKKKEYQQAAALYEKVREAEDGKSPATVTLNLAHSYFHLREYTQASPLYRSLLKTQDKDLLSTVATQLAVIEAEEGNYTKAIDFCKQALKARETNATARYNFELLQKYLLLHPEKRQGPKPPQKRTDQNGPGGSRQPNANGSSTAGAPNSDQSTGAGNTANGGPSTPQNGQGNDSRQENFGRSEGLNKGYSNEGRPDSNATGGSGKSSQAAREEDALLQTRFERLKKLQLSPEKARQLLDAMRQEEAQYLQQLPRRTTKPADKNTPDW
ncbi:tetratricopeptide repeat protein [Rufibacter aurantiacus]|uniref:tetratricopeptide repeat protein n=1 Tax=Rufibacter aurantiacus TaxID=2817374 RepID=UPI001B3172C6|nr:tetratricopeptide repeat protein [Rufibacter aurantiacus]